MKYDLDIYMQLTHFQYYHKRIIFIVYYLLLLLGNCVFNLENINKIKIK